jgi:NADP-dependent aldehyde dehydrogenase
VIVGRADGGFQNLRTKLAESFSDAAPGTMLYPNILKGYEGALSRAEKIQGVHAAKTSRAASAQKTEAAPALLETDANTWLSNEELSSEIFGPSAIVVNCASNDKMLEIAQSLPGTLTVTIHGTPEDLEQHRELIAVLETKAGRLIFNGFPTGVEVSSAMHHGGPFPATGDAKFTSVGTAAILRFLRPVCYQNFPQKALPEQLRDENPRRIWRTINGQFTQEQVKQPQGVA